MKERKRERQREGGGTKEEEDGRREGEEPSSPAGEFSSPFSKQVLLYIKDN